MTMKNKQDWELSEQALREFVQEKGRLPKKMESHRNRLIGRWCGRQRTKYKKGALSKEHSQRLEQIPGWAWAGNYDALQEFVKEKGRLPQ